MCLHTQQEKPIQAIKDIKVYKTANTSVSNTLSKEASFVIKNGRVIKALVSTEVIKLTSTQKRGYTYQVGRTLKTKLQTAHVRLVDYGFHSYANKKTMIKHQAGNVVMTCIIPKGALYYKGTNNGRGLGYCSDQLKIISIESY